MKPCHELKYCPYGTLVEFFPLHGIIPAITLQSEWMQNMKIQKDAESCKVFGHDCPVYYVKEEMIDGINNECS